MSITKKRKEYDQTVGLRLPDEILEEIDRIAQEEDRTRANVIKRLIIKSLKAK